METVRVYHYEEIKNLDALVELMGSGTPACADPPEGVCDCKKCFEYEITIDKINEKIIKNP